MECDLDGRLLVGFVVGRPERCVVCGQSRSVRGSGTGWKAEDVIVCCDDDDGRRRGTKFCGSVSGGSRPTIERCPPRRKSWRGFGRERGCSASEAQTFR